MTLSPFKSRRRIALTLAVLPVVLGVLLALAPIRASSGHLGITSWFLHTSMQAAVFVQSRGVKAPRGRVDDLRWLGAAHYEGTCRPCHGAPGDPALGVFQHATPPPPTLEEAGQAYGASELFFIVRHGVKFTGMPAWPAQQREDEVWPVVAFLQALPGMSPEEYRALAEGPSVPEPAGSLAPPVVKQQCARCHGLHGNGRKGELGRGRALVPFLSAQKEEYLLNALVAYARGERASGIMQPVAARSSPQDWAEAASWYSRQPRQNAADATDTQERNAKARSDAPRDGANHAGATQAERSAHAESGRRLALQGSLDRRVPACADCHGPSPEASSLAAAHPRLEGLPAEYLVRQLELFAAGDRGGSRYAERMTHVRLHRLDKQELRAVAAYYSQLRP